MLRPRRVGIPREAMELYYRSESVLSNRQYRVILSAHESKNASAFFSCFGSYDPQHPRGSGMAQGGRSCKMNRIPF
jgi:hypothetical protein